MLRDLASQKKIDRQAVIGAIESLRAKGWDINPYTIADEIKIPRTAIYRDSELMELISSSQTTAAHDAQAESLNTIEVLQNDKQKLEDQVKSLQTDNELLQYKMQESWQLGYDAGIKELEARLSDTTVGATISLQPEPTSTEDLLEAAGDKEWDDAPVNDQAHTHDAQEPDPIWQSEDSDPEQWPNEPTVAEQSPDLAEQDKLVSEDALRDLLQHRIDREQTAAKEAESTKKSTGSKFVGGNKAASELPPPSFVMRSVPPDIRKACLILGLRPEDLTRQSVHSAWKREITNPGGHPDIGGETEIAIYLNTAKDVLYTFLDLQEPKLAKKFGTKESKANHE